MSTAEDPRAGEAAALVGTLCRQALDGHGDPALEEVAVSRSSGTGYAGAVFASSGRATELESLQETLGEGPGPEVLRLRAPVLVPDLIDDVRTRSWVGFVRSALLLGVRSVHAFPLQVGASSVGLLTVHGTAPAALSDRALARVLKLSDAVAIALLTPQLGPPDDPGAEAGQLAALLDGGHAVTHQALGMVSVQLAGSIEDALAVLRARAFTTGTTLVDVAREVVARRLSFRDGEGHPSSDPPGLGPEDTRGDRDDH